MRVGKFIRHGELRPFISNPSGAIVEWAALDSPGTPGRIRSAVRAALTSPQNGEFLAAVPLLEEYCSSVPEAISRLESSSVEEVIHSFAMAPPVYPRTFICVGLNYLDHARESNMALPERPLLFSKTANAISGHGCSVHVPLFSCQLDFEAELAVVIGKCCFRASAASAFDYVAGYTCANDISARDFQFADGQWFRGKSCDGFGPLGPWLVTKDEIPDPHALAIRCRVNGTTMQDSSTSNLIFRIPQLIEYISSFITLQPGDVIATGTPPGVGFAKKPPVYLQPGDVVEIDIENIGVLRNTITEGGD